MLPSLLKSQVSFLDVGSMHELDCVNVVYLISGSNANFDWIFCREDSVD